MLAKRRINVKVSALRIEKQPHKRLFFIRNNLFRNEPVQNNMSSVSAVRNTKLLVFDIEHINNFYNAIYIPDNLNGFARFSLRHNTH